MTTSRRLLIVTGPQGAGNHLFAKLLSLHPDVKGWPELLSAYWVKHEQAPFVEIWAEPERLAGYDFRYAVASVSVPYVQSGETRWPKIVEALTVAEALGIDTSVCIVVRDSKINQLQQQRVRGEISLYRAVQYLANLPDPYFISHECVYLYRSSYLRALSSALNFPIAWEDRRVEDILAYSSNDKYVTQPPGYWLDKQVGRAAQESQVNKSGFQFTKPSVDDAKLGPAE